MTYVIDYSAAQLTGTQVKSAGYAGSVRYVPYGAGTNAKFATVSEVQSQITSGLQVALVYEVGVGDAAGGFDAGVIAGQAIRDFANACNIVAQGYIAQDAWLGNGVTAAQLVQYCNGAASILGWAYLGLYGFIDAHQATASLPLGARWLCGAQAGVNQFIFALWQDNNWSGAVAGVSVDRNFVYTTNWLQASFLLTGDFLMALPDWQQQRIYDRILSMSAGVAGQNFDGDQFTYEQGKLAATQAQLTTLQANFDAFASAVQVKLNGVTATVDPATLKDAITEALKDIPGVDYAQVQLATENAVKAVLAKTQS